VYHIHISTAGDEFTEAGGTRKAVKSASVKPATRWGLHGMNLPVFDEVW
jgi:hypothetical protein